MIELLDVLDEKGVATGKSVPRPEVHKNGLWHATVHIYVYSIVNNMPQILVHLRSASKDLYPNTWDPVLGGHVKSGNTATQTAIEELSDEIDLSISSKDLIVGPVVKTDKGPDKEFNHIYGCKFPQETTLRFRDKEVQKAKWMKSEDVLQAIKTSPSKWRPTLDEFSAVNSVIFL